MQIKIPEVLLKYLRMSPSGLVHNSEMPDELLPIFEKTKEKIKKIQESEKQKYISLMKGEKDNGFY